MISVKLLFIFSLPRRARESLSSYTDWASGTEITAFGREESLGKYRIWRDPACRGRKWLSDRVQNWSDRQQVELYTCSSVSRVPSVKKRCIWKGFFFFWLFFQKMTKMSSLTQSWQECTKKKMMKIHPRYCPRGNDEGHPATQRMNSQRVPSKNSGSSTCPQIKPSSWILWRMQTRRSAISLHPRGERSPPWSLLPRPQDPPQNATDLQY